MSPSLTWKAAPWAPGETPRALATRPGKPFLASCCCRLETKVIPTEWSRSMWLLSLMSVLAFGGCYRISHTLRFRWPAVHPRVSSNVGCFWKVLWSHRGIKTQPWDLGYGGALGGRQRRPVSLASATWVSCGTLLSGPTTK